MYSTLHIGYMAIGYKAKSVIRPTFGWYQFPYLKTYWILGQILVVMPEISIIMKLKHLNLGYFHYSHNLEYPSRELATQSLPFLARFPSQLISV